MNSAQTHEQHHGSHDAPGQGGEEGDDPVVATFDVFNAASLGGSLHLFQFPLRAAYRPYEASSMQMAVTNGALEFVDTPRQGGTTVGGGPPSVSPSVINACSRVLLSCEFDTFNYADSFAHQQQSAAGSAAFGHHPERQRAIPGHVLRKLGASASGVKQEEDLSVDNEVPAPLPTLMDDASTAGSAARYRYCLRSEPFLPRSEYAVGVFRDGGLHLTTLSTIQQFTPVIPSPHSNTPTPSSSLSRGKRPVASAAVPDFCNGLWVEDEHCSRKPADDNGSFQATSVGPIADMIQRQLRRQRSFAINTDVASTRSVDYFRANTVESSVIGKRLLCSSRVAALSHAPGLVGSPASSGASFGRGQKPQEAIFPLERIVDHGATLQREYVLGHSGDVSIMNQVRDLIQSSQVLSMRSLMALLVPPTSSALPYVPMEAVFDALRSCALYLHGVWVAKVNERSFKGNSAAMREVILWKFWQSTDGMVRREDLNRLVPSRGSAMVATIKSILESISILSTGGSPHDRLWRLKELPQSSVECEALRSAFAQDFPSEYQFQQAAWAKRVHQIAAHIPSLESGKLIRSLAIATAAPTLSSSSASASPNRNAQRTHHPPASGSTTMPGNERSTPTDAAIVTQVRNFTRRLFLEHGVINKQRAKELISKARTDQFPDASNAMLSAGVQSEVHQFTVSTWVLKELHEPETDLFRPFLLSAILELDNFESRVVVQRASELYHKHLEAQGKLVGSSGGGDVSSNAAGQNIPQRVVQRVLSEVAVYRSAERLWHVKSGNIQQQ